MILNIGTLSPTKINAIKKTISDYKKFNKSKIKSVKVKSGVSDQPLSLEETITGAKNRSKNAFKNCDYSFGIESGLMPVTGTKTGYMGATVCAIFDGKLFHLGIASMFEYPKKVIDLVLDKKLEISDAFKAAGLTKDQKLGYTTGGIGIVTNGRVIIEDYYQQAIMNALAHIEKPHLYR